MVDPSQDDRDAAIQQQDPRLWDSILRGRALLNDPYWNGGGAVCGRYQTICEPMYVTICSHCGHPISWHRSE